MSMDKLIEKIAEKQNPTVAGLDPKLELHPGAHPQRNATRSTARPWRAQQTRCSSSTRALSTPCAILCPQ